MPNIFCFILFYWIVYDPLCLLLQNGKKLLRQSNLISRMYTKHACTSFTVITCYRVLSKVVRLCIRIRIHNYIYDVR